MEPLTLTDLTVFVTREGDQLVTDSRAVASAFNKRHKNVLQIITGMLRSQRPLIAEHARSNFGLGFYLDANGRQRPMYRMTQRGLNELAMGFTGQQARLVRLRLIDEFNSMSAALNQEGVGQTEKRACANCCAYENSECMNGLGYVDLGDRCDQHRTWAEDRREDEALNRFRVSLGLPPRRPIE